MALEGADAGRISPLDLSAHEAELATEPPPLPRSVEAEPPPLPQPTASIETDEPATEWKYFGRAAFWHVERSDELARLMLEREARREDPEAAVAARSAWLALFVAASCLLVTYSEFRAYRLRGSTPGGFLTAAFPPRTDPVPNPDAVPGSALFYAVPPIAPPAPRHTPPRPFAPAPVAAERQPAPARQAPTRRDAPRPELPRREPARYVPVVTTATVTPPPPAVVPPSANRVANSAASPTRLAPPATSAPVVTARVASSSPELPVAPAQPTPVVAAAPPAAAARIETAALDDAETDIRRTLTRFRTAYSQLNASAAQEVWPSVDVRALRSAFRGLKSQQLHFDQCQLTVSGARARAACTGRAIYVPGVGDQSPRTSPRAWNFELTKAEERWTIASARSS